MIKNKYISYALITVVILAIFIAIWPFNDGRVSYTGLSSHVEHVTDESAVSYFKKLVVEREGYYYPGENIKGHYLLGASSLKVPDKISSFEIYGALDSLGRVSSAYGCLSRETMPGVNETREDIYHIRPSGWNQKTYDFITDGKALWNRCHLIGWYLSGENANWRNLMTGTRFFNTQGMLPIETAVFNYLQSDRHVLYLVKPVFEGDNLVAYGVIIEAISVEDQGAAINMKVFCPNVQPEVAINYKDGSSVAVSSLAE